MTYFNFWALIQRQFDQARLPFCENISLAIFHRQFGQTTLKKAGNDVINILIGMDIENTLGSRMLFRMNFSSGVFSSETLLSYYRDLKKPRRQR